MRIVLISDTHGLHDAIDVPEGDLLVHAGDLTKAGEQDEVAAFARWFADLPHPHKVVIAGNHDFLFERKGEDARCLIQDAIYLQDQAVEIGGVRIWGSPWQPWFYNWAFNLARGAEIREKWDLIPEDTDLLITHGPPLGHGDVTQHGDATGCADLLDVVRRIGPRLHVFGHIHEGYGVTGENGTTFVNATTCDVRYRPVNPPVVLEWGGLVQTSREA
jgi:Icc-related predicted phosphoesterase